MVEVRNTALQFAVRGLIQAVVERGAPGSDLTTRNAVEVVTGRLGRELQRTLDAWQSTGEEPDWCAAIDAVAVDGESYVGPTGGWIDFADSDAARIGEVARREVGWTRAQMVLILQALGG